LIDFIGILFDRTLHHDEAMGLFPFLRLVLKLRYAPTKMHCLKTGAVSHRKEVLHLGGNDDVAAARLVQVMDQFARKITGVGQETNPGTGDT